MRGPSSGHALPKIDSVPLRIRLKIARPDGWDGCWIWEGARDRFGYGKVWWRGRTEQVHRVLYTLVGEIEAGQVIRHGLDCTSRACVNPEHLTPGTQIENVWDRMQRRGR